MNMDCTLVSINISFLYVQVHEKKSKSNSTTLQLVTPHIAQVADFSIVLDFPNLLFQKDCSFPWRPALIVP